MVLRLAWYIRPIRFENLIRNRIGRPIRFERKKYDSQVPTWWTPVVYLFSHACWFIFRSVAPLDYENQICRTERVAVMDLLLVILQAKPWIHSLFTPGPIRSLERIGQYDPGQFALWPSRFLELSFPGANWPGNFRSLELPHSRVFAPRNIRSLELSFPVSPWH